MVTSDFQRDRTDPRTVIEGQRNAIARRLIRMRPLLAALHHPSLAAVDRQIAALTRTTAPRTSGTGRKGAERPTLTSFHAPTRDP